MLPVNRPGHFLSLLLCMGFLGATATAQTSPFKGVFPKGGEWIEAPTSTHIPFGLTAGISQQAIDSYLVPGENSTTLFTGFAIRRDGRVGGPCSSFQVQAEIGMSSNNYAARAITTNFANNRGLDFTLVFMKGTISFPATNLTTRPAPFLPPIPFHKPFLFKRNTATGLMMETRIYSASASTPGANFKLDSNGMSMSLVPPKGASAPGCKATPNGKPLNCELSIARLKPANQLSINVKHAAPMAPIIFFFGRNSSQWVGIPLPLDLSPMGATGCKIYIDCLCYLTGVASTTGTWTLNMPLPGVTIIPGATPIYGQAYSTAAGVNPMGIAASNGASTTSFGSGGLGWVYELTSPTATIATKKIFGSAGPITQLNFL